MARKLAIRSRYAISRVTYARAGPPGPLPRCASRLLTKLYRDYGEVLARGERWALSVDVGRDDDECRLTRVVPLRWSSGFPDRYLSGNDCLNPSRANSTLLGPIRWDPGRRGAYPSPWPRTCLTTEVRRAGISPGERETARVQRAQPVQSSGRCTAVCSQTGQSEGKR